MRAVNADGTALTPEQIQEHVEQDGERRLSRPLLELVSTAFFAGLDIVLGIVALGVAHHLVAAETGPTGASSPHSRRPSRPGL